MYIPLLCHLQIFVLLCLPYSCLTYDSTFRCRFELISKEPIKQQLRLGYAQWSVVDFSIPLIIQIFVLFYFFFQIGSKSYLKYIYSIFDQFFLFICFSDLFYYLSLLLFFVNYIFNTFLIVLFLIILKIIFLINNVVVFY